MTSTAGRAVAMETQMADNHKKTISHHLLRRRARTKATQLDRQDEWHNYMVEKTERGPWRWRVVRVPKRTTV